MDTPTPNATTGSGVAVAVATPSSSSPRPAASSSSSSSLSPTRLKPLGDGETCSLLAVDTTATRGCRAPRSCTSCLETSGCTINANGKCVGSRDYSVGQTQDYTQGIARGLVVASEILAQRPRMRGSQSWQFSAGTVRYCDASDTTCSTCRQNNFWRSNATFPDSRFCLGDDGACVCVDVCERRWYVSDGCGESVAAPGYTLTPDDMAETLWRGLLGLVALSCILLVLYVRQKCIIDDRRRRQRLETRRARSHERSRALGVNVLTLSGWESYRRDLIDKEKAQHMDEGGASEEGEIEDEIRSPRLADGALTAFERLDDGGSSGSSAQSRAEPLGAQPNRVGVYFYNEATPGRQPLAPLAARESEASAALERD